MEELTGLIEQGISVATKWKTLGAVAGLATLVGVLVSFTKTSLGNKLLEKVSANNKWVRPLVACVLGFALGMLSAKAIGKTWAEAFMAGLGGIGAALGAVGAHETITASTAAGRERRAAAASVEHALTAADGDLEVKVEALKAELDKARALPDTRTRLAAIAKWANANPPAKKP